MRISDWSSDVCSSDLQAGADQIAHEAARRQALLLQWATEKSPWYAPQRGKALHEFPILEKEQLLANMDQIRTMEEREGIVSLTGGTTGARSEEHTSELQSLMRTSYADFCLKKKI